MADASPFESARILIVDDEAANVALLDGDHAPVDLLLTDVIMPSMNGAELARRVRVRRPALRVLFMSGYTDDVLGRQGTLAPGTDLLPKPFSRDDLLRKVREVLDTAVAG